MNTLLSFTPEPFELDLEFEGALPTPRTTMHAPQCRCGCHHGDFQPSKPPSPSRYFRRDSAAFRAVDAHPFEPEWDIDPAKVWPGSPSAPQRAAPVPVADGASTTSGFEVDGPATSSIACILGSRLKNRPISFIARYLRDLSRTEAHAVSDSGLLIVSCWELGHPTERAYFTRSQGSIDGGHAFAKAKAIGQPANTPIYFAVDYDASLRQDKAAILDYFEGVREAYNTYYIRDTTYAIGVYGNGCVLEWCRTQGIASFFWQAFAPGWCNNRQFWPGANLHTFSLDTPPTCHRRLGRLEGWGKEGGWMLARSPLMPTRAKDVFPGAPLPISTPPIDAPAPRSGPLEPITRIAAASAIARYVWKDRGVAPAGYIKGMALVYARVYCKLRSGDAAALEMARARTADTNRDALAWCNDIFSAAGMNNDVPGVDTLRHLFVLLIGLGMRESSGKYCEGRDRSARNTTADTAEAGLFQTSFNARTASPLLPMLFAQYSAHPSGFLEIFREHVRCSAPDLENFGLGDGREFQRLSKQCPAFAAEFAAVALRHIRTHWGPINRKAAEVRPECDALLRQVQALVDASPGICAALT